MNIQISNNCEEEASQPNEAYTIIVCKLGGGKTGPQEAHKVIMEYANAHQAQERRTK